MLCSIALLRAQDCPNLVLAFIKDLSSMSVRFALQSCTESVLFDFATQARNICSSLSFRYILTVPSP